ncbi:GCN5-related N-acetyltransferase [Chloroherpeton thalassium ATCC 35110]|uniref:GCN5-related N-acetyltransferase n=1 Tax=Chloroherpeton thalassium (strain ATCC 35110 / GB-78) TaxID=517418 RepID=B3QXH0_CHLT3|nr:GNAT family N-acetyltransferase [Chloroherpeton thalassium]ACF13444.1 GCN5-related N-acetyltransferase [Chloroherpeton thalassium ATCC 35110]
MMKKSLKVEILAAQTEQELRGIEKIAQEIWREYYPSMISPDQIEYMLKRGYSIEVMKRELNDGVHYDQLFVDDLFSGYCAYGPDGEPGTLKLHKLYLKPSVHGFGLGQKLLTHVRNYAQQAGFERILLQVNKYNARAIAAYKRFGFNIREANTFDIGEGFFMDDFVMELCLREN